MCGILDLTSEELQDEWLLPVVAAVDHYHFLGAEVAQTARLLLDDALGAKAPLVTFKEAFVASWRLGPGALVDT